MTAVRRGRPRDASLDAEILDATVDELIDRGFGGLTIEGVAQRAGVAKTTVYRRWSDTAELTLSALRSIKPAPVEPPAGSVAEQLWWLLDMMRRQWNDPRWSAVMRRVAADATTHSALYAEHRDRLVQPHVEIMTAVLRRGVAEGVIRPDVDIDGVRLLIVAPVIASAMTVRPALAADRARAMLDTVLRGAAPLAG